MDILTRKKGKFDCFLQLFEDTENNVYNVNPECHVLKNMLTNWQIMRDIFVFICTLLLYSTVSLWELYTNSQRLLAQLEMNCLSLIDVAILEKCSKWHSGFQIIFLYLENIYFINCTMS